MSAFGGGSFLDILLQGIKRVWRNGFALPQRPVINFINFPLVVDNPSLGTTDVYGSSTGGSTGAALAIVENNGIAMPFEPAINFVGFVLGDDPGNSRTNISPPALGTVGVVNGGTGRTSLTSHSVLLGEGSGAVGFANPTSSDSVLTDNGPGFDPTFRAPSAQLTKTTANFTQPAIGSAVTVAMTSTASLSAQGIATLRPGGIYTVAPGGIIDGAHASLVYRGGPGGTAPTGTVVAGAVVSVESPNVPDVVLPGHGLSLYGNRPCINGMDPKYGLVPGGLTDNIAGLNAALADAVATHLPLYLPPLVFGVASEWQITSEVEIVSDYYGPGNCAIILAMVAMRATLSLHGPPCKFRGIMPDGNRLAFFAQLEIVSGLSEFDDCGAQNGLIDGIHAASTVIPPTTSATTQVGPGPAVTISPRNTYGIFPGQAGGTIHFVIKVQTSGVLGSGSPPTFLLSIDGGATYPLAGAAQTIYGHVQLVSAQSGTVTFTDDSGYDAFFAAGTYSSGTTYAVTASGGSAGNNDTNTYNNFYSNNNGSVYASAGLIGNYSVNQVLVAGTFAAVAGSQVLVGTGTSLLALGTRTGDVLIVNHQKFLIIGVQDDFDVVVENPPRFTGSGYDYVVSRGFGNYEFSGSDNNLRMFNGGLFRSNPIGFHMAGFYGGSVRGTQVDQTSIATVVIGGGSVSCPNSLVEGVYVDNFPPDGGFAIVGKAASGTQLRQAKGAVDLSQCVFLSPTFIDKNSIQYGMNSAAQSVPIFGEQYRENAAILVNPGDVLPIPDFFGTSGTQIPTHIVLAPSATVCPVTMPPVPADPSTGVQPDGLVVMYEVGVGNFGSILMQHEQVAAVLGAGPSFMITDLPELSLFGGQRIRFMSRTGMWMQMGPTHAPYGGFYGYGPPNTRLAVTTNATPIVGYLMLAGNTYNMPGGALIFDIYVNAVDGTSFARWRVEQDWYSDVSGNVLLGPMTVDLATGSGAGSLPPAGWAFSFSISGTNGIHLNLTGDPSIRLLWYIRLTLAAGGKAL